MLVFCTLFDSNYLDKGLLLYRSLLEVCSKFRIYVLAMDKQCGVILQDYKYPNMHIIWLNDFIETCNLTEIYKNRSHREFCWTCTSFLIDYVLKKYQEPICTYIDADLYFYADPQCLIDEMGDKTVQIVGHRFSKSKLGEKAEKESGKYCVQFNTFKNTPDSLELLQWWKNCCFEACSSDSGNNKVFGDQGYLNDWDKKDNVNILKNLGGGVAPWNISQYKLISTKNAIVLSEKKTKKEFKLVFYHFHSIRYIDDEAVNLYIYETKRVDHKLVIFLYEDYLKRIHAIKDELSNKYGIGMWGAKSYRTKIGKEMKRSKKLFLLKIYRKIEENLSVKKSFSKSFDEKCKKILVFFNIYDFSQ